MPAFVAGLLLLTWAAAIASPTPSLEPVETVVREPGVTRLEQPAAERLTRVRPDSSCRDNRVEVALEHVEAALASRAEDARRFSVRLEFTPGPSFVVSGVVVNLIAALRGELTVGRGAAARSWTIRQFNFLNQVAQTFYDAKAERLSLLFPVVLEKDNVQVHASLSIRGTVAGREVRWDTLRFAQSALVALAFPLSPPVHTLFDLPASPSADAPASQPAGHANCCQGAWCAECSAGGCPAGGCSYLCEVCIVDGCRFNPGDCGPGMPACCFRWEIVGERALGFTDAGR